MSVSKEAVKAQAEGRWNEILTSPQICGIAPEFLTGRHSECPKCGGTDRWRYYDDGTGGAICNQCSPRMSDGLEVIQWYTGATFPEAIESVAGFLGITKTDKQASQSSQVTQPARPIEKKPAADKPDVDFSKSMQDLDWSPVFGMMFLESAWKCFYPLIFG